MTPKAAVTMIASLLIASCAIVIAGYLARYGYGKIVPHSVRFALTCALSISLIRGWSPGRWIAVGLLGLTVIAFLIHFVHFAAAGRLEMEMTALAVTYAVCLIGLLTPFAGRHFGGKATGELESPDPSSVTDANSQLERISSSLPAEAAQTSPPDVNPPPPR